jgi:hypothetical protein
MGRDKQVADPPIRTPPRKIRARFHGYKHISLNLKVVESSAVRLSSAQKTILVTFVVTLGRRKCCRVGL